MSLDTTYVNPEIEAAVKRFRDRCRTATTPGDYDRFRAEYLAELRSVGE